MNSLRRTVPLETIPLSSVIRLLLADLFRHQNWVACGLEEQAAQHDVVPNGKRGTSGNTFKLCPGGNEDLHLVDAIAGEQRWQVVDGKVRRVDRRYCAWELRHMQFHTVRSYRRARYRGRNN